MEIKKFTEEEMAATKKDIAIFEKEQADRAKSDLEYRGLLNSGHFMEEADKVMAQFSKKKLKANSNYIGDFVKCYELLRAACQENKNTDTLYSMAVAFHKSYRKNCDTLLYCAK